MKHPRRLSLITALVVLATASAFGPGASAADVSTDGSGLVWGDNSYGQLGNGTYNNSNMPMPVILPAGTMITAIDGGHYHSLALTSAGRVLAWGDNDQGQLGNGTNTDSTVPVPVSLPAGTTITAIAASYQHSLALTSTGTVLAWGDNSYGQLGNGTTANSTVPVPVSLLAGTTVTAIAAGFFHSLALTSAGSVLAWGDNRFGQLGDNTWTSSIVPVSVSLPGGTTIDAIAAGDHHGLGLTSTGTVLAWGSGILGQLGNGTGDDSPVPVPVSLPDGVAIATITGGGAHSLALTSTGSLLAWGGNYNGQLGNGTNGPASDVPVAVILPDGVTIATIAGGDSHSLASTSAGGVLAWGRNDQGQLGNGTTTDSNVPVPVILPAGTTITAIAGGARHTLAVTPEAVPVTSGTTLRVSAVEPVAGQPVTLTATVACSAGAPTGTVTFLDGATSLGTGTLSGGPTATATLTTSSLAPGSHSLSARYEGDGSCPASTATPVTVTVMAASSATTLQAPSSVEQGQPVTLTATVSCNAGTPTGAVTFHDGTTAVGTGTLAGSPTATASVTLPNLTPGTHTLSARYGGDGICPPSQSGPATVTVSTESITNLQVSPRNPRAGQPISLTGTVTCQSGTPIGTVTFYDGTTSLGTATLTGVPKATATMTATLTAGSHSLLARHNGDGTCSASQSKTVQVTVRS